MIKKIYYSALALAIVCAAFGFAFAILRACVIIYSWPLTLAAGLIYISLMALGTWHLWQEENK